MFTPNSMYNYSCPENVLRYELLKRMCSGLGDNIFSIYPYFDFDRARKIYDGMIKAGYLEPITLEDFLQGMTLAELKPLCKENGLKVSGKKADLIASLISNVDAIALGYTEAARKGRYSLTDSGHKYLNELAREQNDELSSTIAHMISYCKTKEINRAIYQWRLYKVDRFFQNAFDCPDGLITSNTLEAINWMASQCPDNVFAQLAIIVVISGMAPRNLLKETEPYWVQKDISKEEAEEKLLTFTHYIYSARDMIGYKQSRNMTHYRFLASLDERTCPICGALDGKIFAIKDAEFGINYPPLHDGCRCTTAAYLDDMDTTGMQRRGRDPITGESVLFPRDLTWEKWKKMHDHQDEKVEKPTGFIALVKQFFNK